MLGMDPDTAVQVRSGEAAVAVAEALVEDMAPRALPRPSPVLMVLLTSVL